MGRTLAELNVIIAAKIEGFEQKLRTIEKRMRKTSRNFKTFGDTVTKSIAVPFGIAATAGVKMATELSANFAKIENLVGVSAEGIAEFKEGVRDLSTEVGQSQADLSRALFTITSAGVKGSAALQVLEQSAKASTVGLGDTTEIARATVAAMTAYKDSNLTAAAATEALFKTVRAGNLEAGELAPALGRVIGVAAEMGVSFGEVGASIATFTRLGVKSEEAVTGLRAVLTTFLNPSAQAREALAQFGISADDVRTSIRENGLSATLLDLSKKLDGNYDALGKVIPNVKALATVLGTAGSQGKDYLAISAELTRSSDELGEAFIKSGEEPAVMFQKALVGLQNAGIDLGNILLPVVIKITKRITGITQAFSNLSPRLKKTIVSTAAWVSGIGLAASGIGRLIGGALNMVKTLRLVTTWLRTSRIAQIALNLAMKANPIGLIITALGAIVGGLTVAYNKSEKFRRVINGLGATAREVFNIIKEAVGNFLQGFKDLGEGEFKSAFINFREGFTKSNPIGMAFTQGQRLKEAYLKGFNETTATPETAEDAIEEIVAADVPELPDFGNLLGGGSTGGAGGAAEATRKTVDGLEMLSNSMQSVVASAGLLKTGLPPLITQLVQIEGATTAAGEAFTNISLTAGAALQSLAARGETSLRKLGAAALDAANNFVRAEIIKGVTKAITNAIGTGPFGLFLAGAAGAAAAALYTSVINSIKVPKLAAGAIIRGPTLAMVGEYPGASNNPEVVTPLDKLQNMLRPSNMVVTGTLRADGSELLAVIEAAENDRYRTAGY